MPPLVVIPAIKPSELLKYVGNVSYRGSARATIRSSSNLLVTAVYSLFVRASLTLRDVYIVGYYQVSSPSGNLPLGSFGFYPILPTGEWIGGGISMFSTVGSFTNRVSCPFMAGTYTIRDDFEALKVTIREDGFIESFQVLGAQAEYSIPYEASTSLATY